MMLLYIISYIMLFIVLFFNLGRKYVWLILIGAFANFIALVLNGGSMPIDVALLKKAGFENMYQSFKMGAMPNYIDIKDAYSLTIYLAKVYSPIYPLKQIFSIGDILVFGLLMFTQNMMQASRRVICLKL